MGRMDSMIELTAAGMMSIFIDECGLEGGSALLPLPTYPISLEGTLDLSSAQKITHAQVVYYFPLYAIKIACTT